MSYLEKILYLLTASALGAIFYRMGGASGYNTKARDFGLPLVAFFVLYYLCPRPATVLLGVLCYVCTFGLMFAAQLSYFKKKGTPALWYHWCLVGLVNGLALIPYALCVWNLDALFARTLFLIVFISLWSSHVENVVFEECGRGALIITSLWLFM